MWVTSFCILVSLGVLLTAGRVQPSVLKTAIVAHWGSATRNSVAPTLSQNILPGFVPEFTLSFCLYFVQNLSLSRALRFPVRPCRQFCRLSIVEVPTTPTAATKPAFASHRCTPRTRSGKANLKKVSEAPELRRPSSPAGMRVPRHASHE